MRAILPSYGMGTPILYRPVNYYGNVRSNIIEPPPKIAVYAFGRFIGYSTSSEEYWKMFEEYCIKYL